jgi:hypothetical protein
MRRLTLILSDLYLPSEVRMEEAGGGLPAARELPMLTWLLRVADAPRRVGDWRTWLLEQTTPGARHLPNTWLATPVALEARLDHVRLVDRGLLRLDAAERARCGEEFMRVFGPQYSLHDDGERAFMLNGLPPAGVYITDPARLLGSEIGPALPKREAGELRRLWTEIEMWLHGAAFNTQRERAGKRRVSALWLWGVASPPPDARDGPGRADVEFHGGDPLIRHLARRSDDACGVPSGWAQLDTMAPHVVLEFAAMTGEPHESLESLDVNWFAPVRAALVAGELRELDLLANDLHFRVGARSHLRFWRRGQSWLSRLGASANAAEA